MDHEGLDGATPIPMPRDFRDGIICELDGAIIAVQDQNHLNDLTAPTDPRTRLWFFRDPQRPRGAETKKTTKQGGKKT